MCALYLRFANLRLRSGDRVEFIELGKGVYRVVAATRDIRDLKGMFAKPLVPVSIEDMKRALTRKAESEKGV